MQVFRYSGPEFSPYEDDRLTSDHRPGAWPAPVATGALGATVPLPGSKSLTNRELVLAALADGPSVLRAPLHSRDSSLMMEALRALGTDIAPGDDGEFGTDLVVTPGELSGSTSIDCGLAGTVMRFIPPVAALAFGPTAFDGDAAARRRPMRTTIDSLRGLGVDVGDDGSSRLPFTVFGTGDVAGGELEIDASASSQFVSGLLLAAPRFTRGLSLTHVGETLPSLPHIEMTIAALAARGVQVATPRSGTWVVEPGPISARDVVIEPDLSNAAPFLAAALVAGGRVGVPRWPDATTQVGAMLEHLLTEWGAVATRAGDTLTVDGGAGVRGGVSLPGIRLDLSAGGELAPVLVALAALASERSVITGIGHLRGHETDRLAALAENIGALGGEVEIRDDGLVVTPHPLHAGIWKAFDDHRIAQAGALIGLVVPGVEIDDIGSTAKTLPEFPDLWFRMIGVTSPSPVDPLSLL